MSTVKTLGVALFLAAGAAHASEAHMNAGQLAHALDRVASPARVLYLAAHPDDENTGLLAYLANSRNVTAAYLSMTRGGGGQNLIGDEKGSLLDVIRTEELLAARGLDAAAQRFTRMKDFGYSKSANETLRVWGHDEALADVVWVIRTFRPDVIVTRFDENPPNHGHHTASAILAREAFGAAADPKRFPEQLSGGVTPWKTKRLLHNLSTWRQVTIPPDALRLDIGGHDARLGLGYAELSAQSRSQHKSQGFGQAGTRGPVIEHFTHLAGDKASKDLLDGVATDWSTYGPQSRTLTLAVENARKALVRDAPERALPELLKANMAFARYPDQSDPRVVDAQRELEKIIAEAAGLFVRSTSPGPMATPGSQVKVAVEIVPARVDGVVVKRVWSRGNASVAVDEKLGTNQKKVVELTVPVSEAEKISALYWLAEPSTQGFFTSTQPEKNGQPRGTPAFEIHTDLVINGYPLTVTTPVVHAWTDRVQGERIQPLLVVPPAMVTPSRNAVMFPNGQAAALELRVTAGRGELNGVLIPNLPRGWKSEPTEHVVTLAHAGDEVTLTFKITPAKNASAIDVRPVFRQSGKKAEPETWRADVIDYPHIPYQQVLQPASVRLVPLALTVPQGLIGYVRGSGDSVAEDLAHVGTRIEYLDDDTLRAGDLSKYAAILVGIRAYNTRDALKSTHPRLMEYVEGGGTVVVQYATSSRWSPLDHPIGPYPLELGSGRVTDETAKMVAVDPTSPLLLSPNRIVDTDFDGWVQERGLYFGSEWDERYTPLFSAADPDEQPQQGGTLVADHGRGRYVYTGLVFFRQLPAGVPGAYRLLVNLLSNR